MVAAPLSWHGSRDGLAETVQFLALVCGSLGKIAVDIMLMMTNELGEAFEPFVKGRGASSTMPQKRNPISCELMWAASKTVRQHAGLALDAMLQDFERATGPWQLTRESGLPHLFGDCERGAIPALGDAYEIKMLLDPTLTRQGDIYLEAGNHDYLVHMSMDQYLKLVPKAEVREVC